MFDLAVWLPGLVFLGLVVWLLRKVIKAARTESDLETERLEGSLAEELRVARAVAAKSEQENESEKEKEKEREKETAALVADVADVDPAHLSIIESLVAEREAQARASHVGPTDVLRRVELVWARSNATHAVWCERRHAATRAARALTRDVICVAQIEKGKVVERWFFG
ncbi:MAG: hypothetical protein ABR567_06075 [Myxococcales bacterium]